MRLYLPVLSVVLWLGDLNYRISDLDVDQVKEFITKNDFETLRNYDQVLHPLLEGFLYELHCRQTTGVPHEKH